MNDIDQTTSHHVLDSSDSRLFRAVQEYQVALDQGNPPVREQFLARHGEIADDLADCLDNLDFLRNIAPQLDNHIADADRPSSHAPSTPLATVKSQLGDFHIVREIGRGGMGVVYEAEQTSMSRRVALKVLPFASILDQKTLERFRREAQIAGQLVHQNIVPVFSVGCERSVHYYAMQFVEGQTLAELIGDLRNETVQSSAGGESASRGNRQEKKRSFNVSTAPVAALTTARSNASAAYIRAAAQLISQVARALEYAHGQGVIHRDIKPSNLMVDRAGKVWVADFGLAHVETGPSVTITGDFLGTLRYMSPEQALAQRVVVDHRTDIYSLGLTLYELLTQQPAFTGGSRQELLRQISFEEPARPRRVNRSIPVDLETILLKAIEKNPADRYDSSEAFAKDLDRFAGDLPICARRPSVVQRASKWCRRHKALVAVTCVAVLAVLVFVAAGSSLLAVRLNHVAAQEKAVAAKERDLRTELQDTLNKNARLLARSYIDKAQALCESGEIGTGMLWLARGLCTAPDDASELKRVIRNSLSAWQQRLPTLRLLVEQEESIYAVALSPDGKTLYTGGSAGTVQAYEAVSGKQIARCNLHKRSILAIVLSSDGKYVVTTGKDGTARVLSADDLSSIGDPIRFSEVDGWWVRTAVFSRDGKQLIAGGSDSYNKGRIITWDIETRRTVKTEEIDGDVLKLQYAPHGLLTAIRIGKDTFELRDVDAQEAVSPHMTRDKAETYCVAISPDGTRFAAAGNRSHIKVWNVATGEVINQFDSSGIIYSLEFNEERTQLLSAGLDQAARLWDVTTGQAVVMPLRHQDPVRVAAFASDYTKILTGTGEGFQGTTNGTARIWDMALHQPERRQLKHEELLRTVVFSSQGLRAITRSEDGYQIRDGDSMRGIGERLKDCDWIGSVQFNPDGSRLAVAGMKLQIRDALTGAFIASAPKGNADLAMAFTPDGRYLLTGGQWGHLILREADTLRRVGDQIVLPQSVSSVAFDPEGKRFVTGCFDGTLRVWDTATLTQIGESIRHVSEVKCLAHHPSGPYVLVGCADGSARVWDIEKRNTVGPSLQHKKVICDVKYSPDGARALTCSTDGMIRIWDSTTLDPIGPPLMHQGGWPDVSFSHDGWRLASTAGEVWEVFAPSISGSVEDIDIRSWTELITGWVLNDDEQLNILTAKQWETKRNRLVEKRLQLTGVPADDVPR